MKKGFKKQNLKKYNIFNFFKEKYRKKYNCEFVERLIKIIVDENIKLEEVQGSENKFIIDDYNYVTTISNSEGHTLSVYDNNTLKSRISISKKHYYWFYKRIEKQEKEIYINNLPDLSEVGRTARKFNV